MASFEGGNSERSPGQVEESSRLSSLSSAGSLLPPPAYTPEQATSSTTSSTKPPSIKQRWSDKLYGMNLQRTNSSVSSTLVESPAGSEDGDPEDREDPLYKNVTRIAVEGEGAETSADITADGRIDVRLNLKKTLPDLPSDYAISVEDDLCDPDCTRPVPSLNIVIFITGSRGDVQPYLSLALNLILCESRHRVRICTHGDFKDFVLETGKRVLKRRYRERKQAGTWRVCPRYHAWRQSSYTSSSREGKITPYSETDSYPSTPLPSTPMSPSPELDEDEEAYLTERLEFFDVGGSPKELMAYMVKNPGLLPGCESIRDGDIGKKKKMIKEMLHKFLHSIYYPDQLSGRPFAADAIISNPPSFAHEHIAEMAGLPLMISFTMPWSPTTEFNHPLVNIKESNAHIRLTNYLTYGLAELMTWQGLGGVINKFRRKELLLPELSAGDGPGLVDRLKIPHMYCWSPAIVPKPKDWKEHIDVVGYFFLQDGEYEPEPELEAFLKAGPPPIYIGFGSIVVDDPAALTQTICDAVKATGVRALVSAGWSEIGGDDLPDDIFILGNVPHDWLFAEGRVSAVCHHGGAGTTAIGLKNGIPTIVVPFFGDQPFQGAMVAKAGAGPEPIPFKKLNVETLSNAITAALGPEIKEAANRFGEQIRSENGEEAGTQSFHNHLPLLNMRCDLDPSRVAIWRSKELALRMSGLAAYTLVAAGKLSWDTLRPHRAREYQPKGMGLFPLAEGVNALLRTISTGAIGVAEMFYKPASGIWKLTTFQLTGMFNMVGGLYDSLETMPRFWGSEIRHREPTGFLSGLTEGLASFAYGFGDGFGGLVYKPVMGAYEDGFLGAGKGLLRGVADMHVKPAAGALALVAQPMKGVSVAINKSRRKQHDPLVKPRHDTSREAFLRSTTEERRMILAAFDIAVRDTEQRKIKIKTDLTERLEREKKAIEAAKREFKAAAERDNRHEKLSDGEKSHLEVDKEAHGNEKVGEKHDHDPAEPGKEPGNRKCCQIEWGKKNSSEKH